MTDVVEILQHWHAGRPKSVVATSLGVDVKTVRKYVAPAQAAGLAPGGPALSRSEWAELARDWFPELHEAAARSLTAPAIAPFHDRIAEMLKTNSVTVVHQRLCDEAGLRVGITSFRRYIWANFPDEVDRSKVTVLRPEVPPGEEAQIDYGYLGTWQDPASARTRRVWAFVMVLAYSRLMFVRPVLVMDQLAWTRAHVDAFAYFGGAPRRLVPDNLATGVVRADLYDPQINRAYAELAAYYGVLVDPARAAKPKDKPRVERPMRYIRDSFYRGRSFASEAEMARAALTWCSEVAGRRALRAHDGASPRSVFDALEIEALVALPPEPFELARWSRPKVAPDCHVKVGRALYSVPWRHLGQRVDARESATTVEIFIDGRLVKTHVRREKGRSSDWSDYPPEKVAFFMRTPTWCRKHAGELGTSVAAVVDELLAGGALHHLRSAQGVIALSDKYGAARLDAACRRALVVGDPVYRTIRGVLAAGTELDGVSVASVPTAAAHLHGAAQLFAGLEESLRDDEVAG